MLEDLLEDMLEISFYIIVIPYFLISLLTLNSNMELPQITIVDNLCLSWHVILLAFTGLNPNLDNVTPSVSLESVI